MGLRILQVDAFAARPFTGNPAAVCLMEAAREEAWMKDVAREMNLSETAFVAPAADGDGYSLRWFTPAVEVALCGHATLASAHALWEEGRLRRDQPARFHTRSGLLTCIARDGWIEMNFPAKIEEPAPEPDGLMRALGLGAPPRYLGRNAFDYLVELGSEEAVRGLDPDFAALRRVEARGIMVTSRASTPGFDFVSRFFAPAVGVNEDPVTGSAHCCLAPYWARRLEKKEMTAYQASARGGVLRLRAEGERVILAGQAVTILRGELAE